MKLERSKRRIVLWAVWVGFALLAPVAQADVLFSASSASGAVSKGYDAGVVTIVTAPHVSAPDATGFAAVMPDRMSNDASWFSATGGGFDFGENGQTDFAAVTNTFSAGYHEFTIEAVSGTQLNLTSIDFGVGRGGSSGVRGYVLYAAVDGGAFDPANFISRVDTLPSSNTRSSPLATSIDLSGAAYQDIQNVTFRFYPFTDSGNSGITVGVDAMTLNGSVSGISTLYSIASFNKDGSTSTATQWKTGITTITVAEGLTGTDDAGLVALQTLQANPVTASRTSAPRFSNLDADRLTGTVITDPSTGNYFQFGIDVDEGMTIDLTSLTFQAARATTGTSTRGYDIDVSINGGAYTDLGAANVANNRDDGLQRFSLPLIATGVTSVHFRIASTGGGIEYTNFNIYGSALTASLSTAAGETVDGDFSVSVHFKEDVTGLIAEDFTVVNGVASSVSGSGDSWSVTITPTSNGDVMVTLPAGSVMDHDGNLSAGGSTLVTTYVAPGSEQPVPTLSTSDAIVYGDFTVQVDFNEAVVGLEPGDFDVSRGTVSSVSGSGTRYSVVVSPTGGGDVTVRLPRNSVTDMDGDNLQNGTSDELVTTCYFSVTVYSPAELLPYLTQDYIQATLSPGTYTLDASDVENTFGTPRFVFEGNHSTYDFTGVTINFAADIYTSGLSMNHLQTLGNHIVLKNLTMVDLCDKEGGKVDGGTNIKMDGSYNRIEGFHMTIKGSYPYGYGDAFGKGGPYTIKHYKHSAFLVRGESNHAKNCTLIHRSYGHAIYMQAASNPTIEGCTIEGEMRSTDDMLAETSGPAYDIDFLTVWGYTLPAGYMKSTGEEGIRAYNAGTTYIDGVEYSRGTSNPTIINNTIVNMRAGVTLTHASGTKYVSGCTAIGCERGYAIGSGIIENCSGDVQYGPIFGVDYESDRGVTADITILPYSGSHYNGSRHFAYIYGRDHNLTFRGMESNPDQALEVNVGGDKRTAGNLDEIDNLTAQDNVINNLTGYPLILDAVSSGITGQSIGTVVNNGSGNRVAVADWSVTSNITFYGTATQSSSSYDAIASLATEQNTSGTFGNGSVTHTDNEAQPWWRIDLEGSYDISEIRIWGRADSNQSRLSDYDVTLFDSNDNPVWTAYESSYPDPMVSLNSGSVAGRYVMIQLRGTNPLSLAEVQIYGTPTDQTPRFVSGGTRVLNGNFVTQFSGEVGEEYTVEWTSSLTSSWKSATNISSLESSPFILSIPATNHAGFYRVRWNP